MMYEMQREGIYEVEFKTLVLHQREPEFPPTKIDSSSTAIPILKAIFGNLDADQEHFVVLFLNNANRVTGAKVLFSGAMDKANVDTRVILRNALLFGATAIIIAQTVISAPVVIGLTAAALQSLDPRLRPFIKPILNIALALYKSFLWCPDKELIFLFLLTYHKQLGTEHRHGKSLSTSIQNNGPIEKNLFCSAELRDVHK